MSEETKEPLKEQSQDIKQPEVEEVLVVEESTEKKEEPAESKSESQEKVKEAAKKTAAFAKETGKKAGEGMKALWADPLVCTRHLDALLDWARETFPAELYTVFSRAFTKLGHVGIVIAGAAGLLFCIISALRMGSLSIGLYGIGYVLLLAIVQYTAHKFLDAGDRLIKSSPSVLTSQAFLQCVALISEAAGILSFFWFLIMAFRVGSIDPFWLGLGIAILCDAIAYIAVHPDLANTSISETASAGEEAIGMLSFFMKTGMRLVPILFGTAAALGTVSLVIATLGMVIGKGSFTSGMASATVVVQAALLPFVAYLAFAVYCLMIELLRAILSLRKN